MGVRPWYKCAVSLFIAALLGTQLWAIMGPREDWPFGANVMFAYDVDLRSPLYDIAFFVRPVGGEWKPLRQGRRGPARDVVLKRKFFQRYFVSDDPRFVSRPVDALARPRRARVEDFAKKVATALRRVGQPIDALRIELARLGPAHERRDARVVFETTFVEGG